MTRPILHYLHGSGCPVCGSPLHRDGDMAACGFCGHVHELVTVP